MMSLFDELKITDYVKLFSTIGDVYLFDNNTKIIKFCNDDENIESEYKSLLLLQAHGFNIPTIYKKEKNYIIMEYIVSDQIDQKHKTSLLKSELEKLHMIKHEMFGYDSSTFCGTIKVGNNHTKDWKTFFKNNRWLPLISKFKDDVEFYNTYCKMVKIYDVMDTFFNDIIIEPSLLHGDINPRNFIVKDEKVYFIDPTCYYGDLNYDHACYNIWKNIPASNNVEILYYIFILTLSYYHNKKWHIVKKINKYCDKLLLDSIKCYPSLINKIRTADAYDYIVIFQGCFNPVHKNHINLAQKSRQYIESKYGKKTLLVLAMAHDRRILKKDNNGIVLYHRQKMLELAIKTHDDVCIDITHLWLDEITDQYKMLYPMVKNVYICCGTDGLKYPLLYCHKDQEFLVINRKGYEPHKLCNKIHIIGDEDIEMSSTKIRKNLDSAKDLLDELVYEYLIKLRDM